MNISVPSPARQKAKTAMSKPASNNASVAAPPKCRDHGCWERPAASKRLRQFFWHQDKRWWITKWHHYLDIYNRYFDPVVQATCCRPLVMLEFGVFEGGSLDMWRWYLGPDAVIVGVDINPNCTKFADPEHNTHVRIGDQSDAVFLRNLTVEFGWFDIVLDDGGHTMQQQKTSLVELWGAVSDGGTYMVEDTHTSYWKSHGGGGEDTFMQFVQSLTDEVNCYHFPHQFGAEHGSWCATVESIHFHDSVVVLEKSDGARVPPIDSVRGPFKFGVKDLNASAT